MKKEMAEKEAKYAEMDETVEVASDIFTSEDEDELLRDSDTLIASVKVLHRRKQA